MDLVSYVIKLSREIGPINDIDYARYDRWLEQKEKREAKHLKELRRIRWNLFKDQIKDKITDMKIFK